MALSLLIGFQQAIIVMHFKLNQDTIEQEFCINKDKPELQCHGTCYLKKQLQQKEDTESASINIYQKVDMLPVAVIELETQCLITELSPKRFIYKETLYTEPYRDIFVPPPIARFI
ncbi:hypothetical protein [Albibacterium bauzanense]|nr:hypothetical protein [Albibacterium bauzanense]